ncbi:triphosphoribosyl-dephospho-CoA synthase CitG [Citrobacter rodentium]|jgi:triphosphoribosyl-dephospho-CoA synthase CitG|uniref:Probable 2-(5''-triphosphoribosyl)-3'-dephosphocoenzyme-A synthase n=2 Tax=Citrobacter rodentium TaxID=67825 RepID=D2TMQ8_CITRI|nr:triphosphoribosyl-dephospho-CoA synthase CitG [Citrobacter rodentium]KIQ50936.1 2-(5'-triphosphoribosyl)-3'-dephospho CoA synthase [Citrobacter rodentium]QBY31841.1 triphosphoribosyl-dephospho-CoA synthase CitG [Citrobacter rodentium]UHO30805.1 triphosphoribosyl-dephospho-CoA synthase CitG [Citrobacter rodentium NBRC 105723 = DSM 16636]CBG87403.1 2-(5''-triphosphoribosyl)-3'-dephosphocoenzyme-A synthase [Citrobacter rodentium ICC168]HAT8013553.1 triphosphoribosyl-dephospho-CoA synthase [Cit
MLPIHATSADTTALPHSLFDAYGHLAWRAMLTEVNLSPKPGLVDRLNCGAHKDMSLKDFHRSALAIQGWLPRFIEYGASCAQLAAESVLSGLRPLGMACEADMFRATAGVNTHKGTIFSLGLLCAAIGRLHQSQQSVTPESLCATAAAFCRGLTERELRNNNQQLTAGQRLYQQLGLTGARGEAEAGYPLVIRHALPHYRSLLATGRDPELALLDTLLLLIALNGDTNVASRGGAAGLRWIQQQAKTLLQNGGIRTSADLNLLHQFDQACIERNLSPGGSADLLIVTWFLAQISQVKHLHNY